MIQKIDYRRRFEKIRKSLSSQRRFNASFFLANYFSDKSNIFSFCSFGSEIDLSLLNQKLANEKRLFFPRIEDANITLYKVNRLENMQISSQYKLCEPNPKFCEKADLSDIQVILVPGLAFDADHYRIGYGKGFYDRFLRGCLQNLSRYPLISAKKILTIGIGFKEQFSSEILPRDPWDLPVDQLLLV